MKNIVVLVSGGGTNLQALIDAQNRGEIKNGRITCVISSNPEAYAIERAAKAEIPSVVIARKEYRLSLEELIAKTNTQTSLSFSLRSSTVIFKPAAVTKLF